MQAAKSSDARCFERNINQTCHLRMAGRRSSASSGSLAPRLACVVRHTPDHLGIILWPDLYAGQSIENRVHPSKKAY